MAEICRDCTQKGQQTAGAVSNAFPFDVGTCLLLGVPLRGGNARISALRRERRWFATFSPAEIRSSAAWFVPRAAAGEKVANHLFSLRSAETLAFPPLRGTPSSRHVPPSNGKAFDTAPAVCCPFWVQSRQISAIFPIRGFHRTIPPPSSVFIFFSLSNAIFYRIPKISEVHLAQMARFCQ